MGADRTIPRPLAAAEADGLFGPLAAARGVALAVSGGADSLALMRLVADWRRRVAPALRLVVLTVDHGLRPESAEEARRVAAWAAAAGLPHETLAWAGPKPDGDLQAAARQARYALLLEACRRHGLSHLATAHHLDDQAETFLLRLARGSGVDGLAAMPASTPRGGVEHVRPLLGIAKARLVATLRAAGQAWIEDPSNGADRFARARLRRLMPQLAREGLDAPRLAATAHRLQRARRALAAMARDVEAASVETHPAGFALCDAEKLAAAEEEIALRVLSRLVMSVGGGRYAPRLERLERLLAELCAPGFGGATLGGCELLPWRGRVLCCRERGRAELPTRVVEAGERRLWDGRFEIDNRSPRAVAVGPLGASPPPELRAAAANLPPRALPAVPAVLAGGEPIAVPGLGWWSASVDPALLAARFVPLDRRAVEADW